MRIIVNFVRATTEPHPGMVIVCDWGGGDNARMRLVRHYDHPAGNGWYVNIYDHRARRFSKVEQAVSEEAVLAAISKAEGGAA